MQDAKDLLPEYQAARFNQMVGLLLYSTNDRPDCQHALKLLTSKMSAPGIADYKAAVHLICYLQQRWDIGGLLFKGKPGRSLLDPTARWEKETSDGDDGPVQPDLIEVFSDADWATDKYSRKSTSGAVIAVNGSCEFWFSRGQKSISASSCESEFLACVSALQEGAFLQRVWDHLEGNEFNEHGVSDMELLHSKRSKLLVRCDSALARALAMKTGLGKAKHVSIALLYWMRSNRAQIRPVSTMCNVADLLTKVLAARRIQMLLYLMHFMNPDTFEMTGEQIFLEELQRQDVKLNMKEAMRVLRISGFCNHLRDDQVYRISKLCVLMSLPNGCAAAVLADETECQ